MRLKLLRSGKFAKNFGEPIFGLQTMPEILCEPICTPL
jgi:hypothetical protein